MKRLIALFLIFTIVFSFAACFDGDSKAEKKQDAGVTADPEAHLPYVGTWKCTLPLEVALLMNGITASSLFGDYTAEEVGCDSTLDLYFEFKEDKTGSLVQKGTDFDAFFLEIYRDYYTFLSDYETASEVYGISETTLDKNAHDQYGVTTWPEAMDKAYEEMEQNAIEAPANDSVSGIVYSVSGNILTVTYTADSTKDVFEYKNGSLVCTQSDNMNGDVSGYCFTKVEIPENIDEEYLCGKWSEMITLETLTDAASGMTPTESFNESLSVYGITLSDLGMVVPNNIPIKYIITFEDGKTTQSIQAVSYFDYLDDFYEAFATYMSDPEIFAKNFIEGGMTELEALCEEQGISIEEYMADELEYIKNKGKETRNDMESNFASGTYTISDNKVIVSSDTDSVEYSYDAGKLSTSSGNLILTFQKD